MNSPLSSGCRLPAVTFKHTWNELAPQTLLSAVANKQSRQPTTCRRTVPCGGNRDTSHGQRMRQPPMNCGEQQKTGCVAPSGSLQHVDKDSKYGCSTAKDHHNHHHHRHHHYHLHHHHQHHHHCIVLSTVLFFLIMIIFVFLILSLLHSHVHCWDLCLQSDLFCF